MNTQTVRFDRAYELTVSVAYGVEDVERAAESLDVPLCGQETDAILADLDSESAALASAAVRSAVASRIYEDLTRVARAHGLSDDD
ncbi:MAG: hypothetical protein JOY68_05575 [Candidatus Dormibacteraeota bacterium]|nr:hypothetical protein [Candidatus Dormibacteraeota bacterium]